MTPYSIMCFVSVLDEILKQIKQLHMKNIQQDKLNGHVMKCCGCEDHGPPSH